MYIPNIRNAVIDIGTNSIKLCIAESSNTSDGYLIVYDKIKTTRLGEGLSESNELGELPSDRSIQAIQRFVALAHEMGAGEIRTIGTAALRKASNADHFCKRVRDSSGTIVEIISGEHEAQLSHNAAVFSALGKDCMIFDIGGGSIEFVYSRNNSISSRFSLNFGVLDIKEKYFLHEPAKNAENDAVNQACLEITNLLHKGGLVIPESNSLLIGIGGTITSMASVKLKLSKFLPGKVNRTVMDINEVESQINKYKNSTLKERAKIPGLLTDRADIILAGACIVKAIMDKLSAKNVIVSTNGLRHGVLAEMFKT